MNRIFLLLILIITLFISACGGGGGSSSDTTVPSNVVMTGATADTSSITLTWTDPADTDLGRIEIQWKESTASSYTTTSVVAGVKTGSISGLTVSVKYSFILTSVDKSGNRSTGVSFNVSTDASSRTYRFIYSAADLNAVRGGVSGYDSSWNLDNSYVLMADIDLASAAWTPLGSSATPFKGIFEGCGHQITGLYVDNSTNYQGLFGYAGFNALTTAGIYNLSVKGTVKGTDYVGGIAGYCWSYIKECSADVTVTGTGDYIGGIVGCNRGNIMKSYSTGSVSGVNRVGGLTGENSGLTENSYETGNVSGTGNYVGGLAGRNSTGQTITKSYATGNVTGGGDSTGGLVGYSSGIPSVQSVISYCYARGTVSGNISVGGLVGYSAYSNISVSYSTGSVTGITDVCGLIGVRNNGSCTGCYYDTDTSGKSDTANGTPLSTANMKNTASYDTSWDFTGTWNTGTLNNGYPYLRDLVPAE